MRRLRISRMSRKPSVAISPVFAPLPSRMALEATVVAVAQLGDVFARERAFPDQPGQRLDDGAGIVVHGGGDLAGQQLAVPVETDDVGKGTADVDSEAPAGFSVFHMSSLSSGFTGGRGAFARRRFLSSWIAAGS